MDAFVEFFQNLFAWFVEFFQTIIDWIVAFFPNYY